MMFHRLKSLHKNQKGFTLIELIVVIAITGLIISAITVTIFQLFNISARSDSHMLAVRQVQNAGYWINHDTQTAQSVETDGGATGFPLDVTWTEWEGDKQRVVYSLVDDKLQREHYTNYDPVTNPDPDSTIFVAEYINTDSTKTNCVFTNGVLTLTVTAAAGDWPQVESETRVYEVIPRPD